MKNRFPHPSRCLATVALVALLFALSSCSAWEWTWSHSENKLPDIDKNLLTSPADTETESLVETEVATESETESETETETETETEIETETESETESEAFTESETEDESEGEFESDFEADTIPSYEFDENTYHEGTDIHYAAPADSPNAGRCVVIDAGHQLPGSSSTVQVGATGTTTGQLEYELNLQVALYLRNELVSRGYNVVMIRETNEVNISNSDRARVANAYASVYDEVILVSIHADSFTSENAVGSHVISTTQNNANASGNVKYSESKTLARCVREAYLANCPGIGQNRANKERDDLGVINASEVPTILLEMGFLSNPGEDTLMATDAFRLNAAAGIANGIDAYFAD